MMFMIIELQSESTKSEDIESELMKFESNSLDISKFSDQLEEMNNETKKYQ